MTSTLFPEFDTFREWYNYRVAFNPHCERGNAYVMAQDWVEAGAVLDGDRGPDRSIPRYSSPEPGGFNANST